MSALEWEEELARLRAVVDASGLTRAEVAAAAGMPPGDLSRLLSGRRPGASIGLIRRVLIACGSEWGHLGPGPGGPSMRGASVTR